MTHAGFSLSISIRSRGSSTRSHLSNRAGNGMFLPRWSVRARGNGAHVWVFFSAPIQASLARKLGAGLLTRTMERRHQVGLKSYDRLFPNQDTMPAGGFGNLIALTLQKVPRRADNGVFVDDRLEPFPDQWRYLTEIPGMEPLAVERLVQGLEGNGNLVGFECVWSMRIQRRTHGSCHHRAGCRRSR